MLKWLTHRQRECRQLRNHPGSLLTHLLGWPLTAAGKAPGCRESVLKSRKKQHSLFPAWKASSAVLDAGPTMFRRGRGYSVRASSQGFGNSWACPLELTWALWSSRVRAGVGFPVGSWQASEATRLRCTRRPSRSATSPRIPPFSLSVPPSLTPPQSGCPLTPGVVHREPSASPPPIPPCTHS